MARGAAQKNKMSELGDLLIKAAWFLLALVLLIMALRSCGKPDVVVMPQVQTPATSTQDLRLPSPDFGKVANGIAAYTKCFGHKYNQDAGVNDPTWAKDSCESTDSGDCFDQWNEQSMGHMDILLRKDEMQCFSMPENYRLHLDHENQWRKGKSGYAIFIRESPTAVPQELRPRDGYSDFVQFAFRCKTPKGCKIGFYFRPGS